MKIPEKDWGYSFNHPKLIHRHTNKFKADPFHGHTEESGEPTTGNWYEELYGTVPGEAREYTWEVPAGVEWVYVFGMGGASAGNGDNVFGMFVKAVTPGDTVTIVVGEGGESGYGGLPDGGNAGYIGDSSFCGGGGSTKMTDGSGIIFVAPGRGGHVINPVGGGASGTVTANWQFWDPDPLAWIGSSSANPAPRMPSVDPDFSLESYALGDVGSGANGGTGASWTLGFTPERYGGGGGGGYGGGPGGPVFKSRYNSYVWHHSQGGRAGYPHVAAPASYAGAPFTQFLNGSPFTAPFTSLYFGCGFLYLRWLEP